MREGYTLLVRTGSYLVLGDAEGNILLTGIGFLESFGDKLLEPVKIPLAENKTGDKYLGLPIMVSEEIPVNKMIALIPVTDMVLGEFIFGFDRESNTYYLRELEENTGIYHKDSPVRKILDMTKGNPNAN